jgi:hypothetical protein
MLNLNLFALTAGLAATAAAKDFCQGPYFSFYNRAGPAMSFARLDPALFPGQESPHLHSFDGGNGLAADMTFETTQASTCTTARVKSDNSLYWRPTLFWNGNNTGYYKVPEKFLKIYYKFGDGDERANVTEFPENFAMMAGDPFKRAEGDNPGNAKWACLGEGYSRIDSLGFPKGFTSCKEGLTSEITFPSCWNGKELDPKKPGAHMAWPSNSGKGVDVCPDGFKVARFPTIFIEFWYDVSGFDGQYGADDVPWSLANGDPTGFGWHADFRNGWKKGVLAKATAETGYCDCGCGCGNDQMKKCFGAENVNNDDDEEFKSCSATPEYSLASTAPLDKLPGCNPLQAGPQRATQATGPDCNAAAAPAPSSGGNSTSDGEDTPTGAGTSQGAATTKKPAASTADANVDVEATDIPTLSKTLKGNAVAHETQVANAGDDDDDVVAPTKTGGYVATSRTLDYDYTDNASRKQDGNTALPSFVPISGASPTATGASGDDICSAPTTITITPTVYVTAGAVGVNATSCDAGTVYATVTNTATITVSAATQMVRHKRHNHKY